MKIAATLFILTFAAYLGCVMFDIFTNFRYTRIFAPIILTLCGVLCVSVLAALIGVIWIL